MTRIASYNIRKSVGLDYQRNPKRVLSVISALNADVVALQEVDRRFGRRISSIPPAMLAERTDLQVIDVAARSESIGWHGNAILVRRKTKVTSTRTLALRGLEPRGAVVVDLALPKTPLRVVGVHLGLRRKDRQAQAVQLADFLAGLPSMPTLIMGDFNEWNRSNRNLSALKSGFTLHTVGESFPTLRPMVGLDKFALSPELVLEIGGVHTGAAARRASDHMPIWAEISAA